MTLQQLIYAVAIADTGSYRRAAEKLFVAQPSLSNALHALENELGVHLFERGGKGAYLTPEGTAFIAYARGICSQMDMLREQFGSGERIKRKFGVSAQHYSFAVKAFTELVRQWGTREYEFAFRETTTRAVIDDVAKQKSEIGVLFLNQYNRSALERSFRSAGVSFTPLTVCSASVYLWKGHPLAAEETICFGQLKDYPCLAFEQGDGEALYLAEEILSAEDYPQIIRATDRATMLNLMRELLGFTLCSGVICDELNGGDYTAVPYRGDDEHPNSEMEIGYLRRSGAPLTDIGEQYIEKLRQILLQENSVSRT